VQHRPAGPVDRPNNRRVEGLQVLPARRLVVRVEMQQPGPATPDADNLVPRVVRAHDERLDAGVEAGDVPAAREDRQLHGRQA
jgi:hypothetical protein